MAKINPLERRKMQMSHETVTVSREFQLGDSIDYRGESYRIYDADCDGLILITDCGDYVKIDYVTLFKG